MTTTANGIRLTPPQVALLEAAYHGDAWMSTMHGSACRVFIGPTCPDPLTDGRVSRVAQVTVDTMVRKGFLSRGAVHYRKEINGRAVTYRRPFLQSLGLKWLAERDRRRVERKYRGSGGSGDARRLPLTTDIC